MIITQAMIFDITCEESIAWFKAHPQYFGLTRKEFNRRLRLDENAGLTPNKWWANWADENFFKSEAIMHSGKLKRQGIYRTLAPGLTPQEFDNIDDALSVLEAAKNKHLKSEEDNFHVQIRQRHGLSGYEIIRMCDTILDTCDPPSIDAYFSTFNMNTGLYEDFPTYTQAKNRMIELKTARTDTIADSYYVEEKIAEIGDPNDAPADFVVVQSVKGRKTPNYDKLDKIERRPDPKPKQQKP
jgi:hypothetical protein